MDKEIEALTPVCVPKRIVRNWAASVMRHCDYCNHYEDTVLNDDGSAICASCCDSEHSGNMQCALEEALQRNGELIAALEQAQRNAMRYQFIRDKDAFGDESEPGLIGWDGLVELDANEFDAAIDARMAHPSVAYAPAPNGMMQLSNELAEMKRKCAELPNEISIETATIIAWGLGCAGDIGKIFKAGYDRCRADIHAAGGTVEGSE